GNRDFLRRGETKGFREPQQGHVKQNIVPLPGNVEPRRLPFLNEQGQPRVVSMAREIASLDSPVPKAWNQHGGAHGQNQPAPSPQKRQRGVFLVQKLRPRFENVLQRPHSYSQRRFRLGDNRAPFYLKREFLLKILRVLFFCSKAGAPVREASLPRLESCSLTLRLGFRPNASAGRAGAVAEAEGCWD